jgi:hypothetical protein
MGGVAAAFRARRARVRSWFFRKTGLVLMKEAVSRPGHNRLSRASGKNTRGQEEVQ